MRNHRLQEFSTVGEMARATADEFARAARKAIDERGRFLAVVPGGSTPRRVFSLFSSPGFCEAIDWGRVFIVPSDERLVSPDDPASNVRMINEELFDGLSPDRGDRNFFPPDFEDGHTPEMVAQGWEARLRGLFTPEHLVDGMPLFDFALLGVGGDGHTASLFPGDGALEERNRWCVAIDPRGAPAVSRVTLTLPVLSRSREVCFIATGEQKRSIIENIVANPAPLPQYPASLVTATQTSWLVA